MRRTAFQNTGDSGDNAEKLDTSEQFERMEINRVTSKVSLEQPGGFLYIYIYLFGLPQAFLSLENLLGWAASVFCLHIYRIRMLCLTSMPIRPCVPPRYRTPLVSDNNTRVSAFQTHDRGEGSIYLCAGETFQTGVHMNGRPHGVCVTAGIDRPAGMVCSQR